MRTPDLLAVLRDAGVVDAGGYALVVIFAGIVAALRGDEPPALEHHAPGARHPSPAPLLDLPLLHQLRGHRPAGSSRAASPRRSRRSATRCWSSATRARSRSTSTPTSPSRRSRCSPAPATVSHLDVADMRAQVARAGAPARRGRALRRARGRRERRHRRPLPEPRRARPRRRADAEPLDLRAARRDPRRAGRGGRRAAQQPERDHGRRARRRAVREAGRRRALAQPADRARRARRADRRRAAPTRTRRRSPRRSSACAAARSRRPRATTPTGASASARRSASSTSRSSPGATPRRRSRRCWRRLGDGSELITCIAGAGAPLSAERIDAARAGRGRARAPPRRPAELLVAAVRRVG